MDVPDATARAGQVAGHFFRHEGAKLVASLTAHLGTHRLQLAEDCVQEALVRALQTWPYRGVPGNPAAWLTQTAKNLALDHLRREQRFAEKESGIAQEHARWLATPAVAAEGSDQIADDRLRLMFVCFHPQLSSEMQTALALRTLCGFSASEIAAAFLSTEAAIEKRLVRARHRIRELALPFAVPAPHELPERLEGVLRTIYLLFNEGYKASTGEQLVRADLCHEAIRLARLLVADPATDQPRTHALLALMAFNAARLSARTDPDGHLLPLREQDRSTWDRALIALGLRHLAQSARGEELSAYHLQAGIAACHCAAADYVSTDWPRILALYDQLARLDDSPVVALNRAVALAQVHGAQAGLDAVAAIRDRRALDGYYLQYAVLADFEMQLGHFANAIAHLRQAIALAGLESERMLLTRRLHECERLEEPGRPRPV
jgi:RNA polymerase sigma-70 factor (ECF subfamily)